MPTLTVSPNPAAPSTLVAVAGAGFQNAKTRLLLDGVGATTNIFRPRRDGTFNVGITVASTAKTQTLVAQQLSGSTWTDKASVSVVVQAVVVTPPPVTTSTMPTTDLPGWRLIFNDDFTTPVAEGSFPSAVSSKWNAYLLGWHDTSGFGTYDPGIVSFHDSLMDVHLRTTGGVHRVAAPYPLLNGAAVNQLYGRYAVRFMADPLPKYKTAWLLWPQSEVSPRDGEIDFPEGDLNSTISAFMHRQNGTSGADQDAYSTTATYPTWHTAVIEWGPAHCTFILDGVTIGDSTSRIPNTPMHWVIQTETWLNGTAPDDATDGHVLIDWVAMWSYAP